MADIVLPTQTLQEYILSNGTKVTSSVPVNFYTNSDIFKIEVAAGILVIAILVLTFEAYRVWRARYVEWLKQKDLEERIAEGLVVDMENYQKIPETANKTVLFVIGGLVILAGLVVMFMP